MAESRYGARRRSTMRRAVAHGGRSDPDPARRQRGRRHRRAGARRATGPRGDRPLRRRPGADDAVARSRPTRSWSSGSPPTTWSPACCWCTVCIRTTCAAGSPTHWTASGRIWVRTAGTSTCSRSSRTTAWSGSAFAGSCKSCPSSAVTLELAVEDAVRAAAPRSRRSKWLPPKPSRRRRGHPGRIATESAPFERAAPTRPGTRRRTWPTLRAGEVGGFRVDGVTVLACRVGDELFAYRDRCGSCGESLAGTALHGDMRSKAPFCDVPVAMRISTWCTPERCVDGNGRLRGASRADSVAGARRCAVDGAVPAKRGLVMGGAYDVLARIRADRGAPQAAGERCEMCAEPIADEHQHVVNVEGRQLMCVCRGCYLLFTDAHAELRYRAVPDRYLSLSRLRARSPGVGDAADPGRARLLLHQLGPGPHRRLLSGTGRAQPSPSWTWTSWNTIRGADPRVDMLADDVEACWSGWPTTPRMTNCRRRSAIWCPSMPATNSSAACAWCGTASTAARRSATSSRSSSTSSPPGRGR